MLGALAVIICLGVKLMLKVQAVYRYLIEEGSYVIVDAHYSPIGDERTALFITMPNKIIHTYTSEELLDECEIERIVEAYVWPLGKPEKEN